MTLFCLYHSLPYWATHSADEVGTQTISPFYWALESGSFHSAKVGCGKELKLGFTRNVGIPQIHPNPTCGRCWYCDTSFTAKEKASNVVCVSVIASLSPVVLSRQAMIIDLLSIRADRDNYYYGCNPSSFEELLSQDITSFIIFHHLSTFFFSKCKSQVFLHLSRDPDSENWQWLSRDPLGDDLFRRHPEVVHKLCTGLSLDLWQLMLCVQNLYRYYILIIFTIWNINLLDAFRPLEKCAKTIKTDQASF